MSEHAPAGRDIVERLRDRVDDAYSGTADRTLLREAAHEIERLRAYLLEIAQGTNEEWTHDRALRAIETSDAIEGREKLSELELSGLDWLPPQTEA